MTGVGDGSEEVLHFTVGWWKISTLSPSALCRGSSGVSDLRWSRIVCPSDRVLRWIPDHVMDFQSTRSGMTVVGEGSEKEHLTLCPGLRAGAQKRMAKRPPNPPVVQYATLPGRDGVPGGRPDRPARSRPGERSVVEGSDTLRLRPAAVTDRTCRSLRPTTHRFACADVPRAAGRKLCIGIFCSSAATATCRPSDVG
jgi:hypothetical protein